MTNLERLDILALAAEKGFHGTEECCGSAAIAINAVLFDGKGRIIMAINNSLLQRDQDFVGHVGVVDENGTIWDSKTVYVGREGVEDFLEWGILGEEYDVTANEAFDVKLFFIDSMEEAREIIDACPHDDLEEILRTAKKTYLEGLN